PKTKFDNLKIFNTIAVICFFYILIITLLYGFLPSLQNQCNDKYSEKNNYNCKGNINKWPKDTISFLQVLPIFIFSFSCHQNAVAVTHELKNNNRLRILLICSITVIIC